MRLTDKQYDMLKWVAINVIPSLTTYISVVGIALQWPHTAVATTIVGATGALIAGIIKMSVAEYEKAKKEQYEGNSPDQEGED